ncbi:MAG TPA: malto-oligosyltrehalose trehalohydrolase [Candidatus Saccharimonadales bacterium]|jgi:maltooligosyltrehalose trehalohydrolase|nr:malto-oligosyltrehalose trehalohydrolase [Candidatus Saccharimonadales bacterium]
MSWINAESGAGLGANRRPDGDWEFSVWAPDREKVAVHLFGSHDRVIPMTKNQLGYHQVLIRDIELSSRYLYQLDDLQEFPDPASRFQPDGVHGPSEIVDLSAFQWTDAGWKAPRLEESIFYELHVGTYSEKGSLDGVCSHLAELADLGVTTIELMPVAQFPGSRNWGYDGVYPFAVQSTYGGPLALQRFVNAAHAHGLAVALDVVYNHLGPEGNYLGQFGPYFTDRYRTPWGQAINFDGPRSDPVRQFFIENAIYWFDKYHIDALRLDAIHGIYDFGAFHILAEFENQVQIASKRIGRDFCLVAESDLNNSRILLPSEKGGYGLPAQWSDDFHHSLHTLLTRETQGYYADFGSVGHLANVLRDGWFYHGQYSRFRRRRHGNSPCGIPRSHFVGYSQNHDQIGNRACGERLSTLVNFEAQKLAAGMTLLSPFVPLLFMGEEYGEPSPFLYFTSHGDNDLVEAVRCGRREEFSEFGWSNEVPDPQDETTFANSKLQHNLRNTDPHRTLRLFYQELIRFRRENHFGAEANLEIMESENPPTLTVSRNAAERRWLMIFNFGADSVDLPSVSPKEHWTTELYSADSRWLGQSDDFPRTVNPMETITLTGQSFVVLSREVKD